MKQTKKQTKQLFKCCRCDGEFDYQLKSCYCNKCYDNYIKELEEEENNYKIDPEFIKKVIECDKAMQEGKSPTIECYKLNNKKKKFNVDEYIKFIFQNTSYDPNAE